MSGKSKRHQSDGQNNLCCGTPYHAGITDITLDPREVTCKTCQKTKLFLVWRARLQEHINKGPCANAACPVCYPKEKKDAGS